MMIIDINKTHEIFKSAEYTKDIVPFSLMELIKEYPLLLKSNEKDFIIGMISPQMPIWIWTSDKISQEILNELRDYFYHTFSCGKSVYFVAKPNVAEMLAAPFTAQLNAKAQYVSMQSFENLKVIPAKNQDVIIEKPARSDIKDIAVCMANFEKDCLNQYVKPKAMIKAAKEKLDNPYLFVIKQNREVVAMAYSSRETKTHITVNGVYTKPEYRGKGFASALVAHICNIINQKGKLPALYTDLSNPSSNAAYKNVGFIEKGRVDEIKLTWD